MKIPVSLTWLFDEPKGRDWLNSLPRLMSEVAAQWGLTVAGEPFSGGNVSYVVSAVRSGERFVLKLQWPDPESEHEGQALKAWNGHGAVRLIEHDPNSHALLLEECRPGTLLADSDVNDPVEVLIDLLPRLWIKPNTQFRTLAEEAKQWAQILPMQWGKFQGACERKLIDEALTYIDLLAKSQGSQVLLHQDLHGHNILSAEREPWLAIDPKPLLGEREFSLAPIVRSFEFGHTAQDTISRLDRLSRALELNRDRALGWTVAQTMAWGFGGAYDQYHQQTVRWLINAK